LIIPSGNSGDFLFTRTHDMAKLSQIFFGTAIEPIEATLAVYTVLQKDHYSSNSMPIMDSNSFVS
jgi:hypothetical protein